MSGRTWSGASERALREPGRLRWEAGYRLVDRRSMGASLTRPMRRGLIYQST